MLGGCARNTICSRPVINLSLIHILSLLIWTLKYFSLWKVVILPSRSTSFAKWRYGDLPIVPEEWLFEVPKDKQKQFKVLCLSLIHICSGFVSYVLTNSGLINTGRLGAQGLYNVCSPVSSADVKPGDLAVSYTHLNTGNHSTRRA